MSVLIKLLGIAVAGGIGTLARYGLAGLVQRWAGQSPFPWGTFAVNILGCLLFGMVVSMLERRAGLAGDLRPFLLTGFMGAFTTFSTLHFETGQLLGESQWLAAAGNLIGQNALGISALLGGAALGQRL